MWDYMKVAWICIRRWIVRRYPQFLVDTDIDWIKVQLFVKTFI